MENTQGDWVTSTTLLHGLRETGNERAWERLLGRFRKPLVAFARRLGLNESDANDAAQDALMEFSQAYRAGRYDREQGRLSAWLFGITRHCVLRHRQREARRAARVEPHDTGTSFWARVPDEKTTEEAWNTEWERWAWEECLARIRSEFEPMTLRAFNLVAEGQMSPTAAAAALGIPVKAVYNAKHRVLGRLRELRADLERDDPGGSA